MTTIVHANFVSANEGSRIPRPHVNRDHRSPSGDQPQASGGDSKLGSLIPAHTGDRDPGSPKSFKVPSITLRLPRYADIQTIHKRWRDSDEYTSKRVAADRLLDAMDRGDLAWISEHYPWFMKAVKNLPAQKNAPPFKDPQSPGSPDSCEDSKERSGVDESQILKNQKRSRKAKIGSLDQGALAAMVAALAEVTGSDPDVCKNALERTAGKLMNATAPYTPDEVRRWKTHVWDVSWRGKKNPELPELPNVETLIGRVRLLPPPAAQEPDAATERATVATVAPIAETDGGAEGEVNLPPLKLVAVDDCGPSGGHAVILADNVETKLLGYAVEVATGKILSLDLAAADKVRKLAAEGFKAEDVAYVLEVIWPDDWRGRDTDLKGNPKPPERITFELLVDKMGYARHHLEMTKHSGPDALGKELQHRIEIIREHVASGQPIVDLSELQSAKWDPLANRYLREASLWEDGQFAPPEPRERVEPERPTLTKGRHADMWLAAMGQFEIQLNRSTFDNWLKHVRLVGYEREGNECIFTASVPHHDAKDWLEKHLMQSWQRLLTELMDYPKQGLNCTIRLEVEDSSLN